MNWNQTVVWNAGARRARSWGARGLLGAAALGLALGCESQADPGYLGEPLLSVTGQVEAALRVGEAEVGLLWLTAEGEFTLVCTGEVETVTGAPSACAAACGDPSDCAAQEQWDTCVESCADVTAVYSYINSPSDFFISGGIGQRTSAAGEFPAQFSLDILEPPPPEALIRSVTGEQLALGLFVALDPSGAPFRIDRSQPAFPEWLLGGSRSHVLAFTPEGIPQDSTWGSVLGFGLGPGYQLLELVPAPDALPDEPGQPAPVAPGEVSQVLLRLAPSDQIVLPFL